VEALYPHLPDGVQKRNLSIRSIKVSPAFPDLLLIAAAIIEEEGNSDDGGLLFSYDLHSEEVTLLVNLPYNLRPYDEFSFSPDGEWLTVKSSARSSSRSQLHLHHLAGQGTIVLNSTYPFGFRPWIPAFGCA
jgi:Tol biopolymer transport system component